MRCQIGLLLFPNLTQLDLTGPYEVFIRFPDTDVHLLWKTLDPVIAGRLPADYFDAAALDSHPHQIRSLAWRLSLTGRKPVEDVVLARTEGETGLIDECRNWIESS